MGSDVLVKTKLCYSLQVITWKRITFLLPSICATLPTSQCSQLKMGRRLESGCGRNAAPIGCTNANAVVAHPRIACGLSSADQSFK